MRRTAVVLLFALVAGLLAVSVWVLPGVAAGADTETRPAHSQRLYDALTGDRQLVLVPGVGHSQTLSAPGVWDTVQRWVETRIAVRQRPLAITDDLSRPAPSIVQGATVAPLHHASHTLHSDSAAARRLR
jgi:hypothetical protein